MTTKDIGIYVTEVAECQECAGQGVYAHPAWNSYWDELGDVGRYMEPEDDRQWMWENGWILDSKGELPPEEVECGECLGDGRVRRSITFQEALEKTGVMSSIRSLSAHLNGGDE